MDVSNHFAFETSVNIYQSTKLNVPENLSINYYDYYYFHSNAKQTLKYTFKERTMHQTIQGYCQFRKIWVSPSIVAEGLGIVEC
jgi:hypothetical protein